MLALSHIREFAYVWWSGIFVCSECLKAEVVGGLRHASFRSGLAVTANVHAHAIPLFTSLFRSMASK